MMRLKFLLISTLALTLLAATGTQQSSIIIETDTVTHTFGGQMIFAITAKSDSDITTATLFMRTSDTDRTEVFQAKITPDKSIKVQIVRDLQTQALAPFSVITYYWRLTDSNNNIFTSKEKQYIYDDTRFNWQTITRGAIVAHWYDADIAFGQYVADTGFQGLERVAQSINAPKPARIDIYVYATISDLQTGLKLGGRTWVGGHADPKIGVVMVTAPADALNRFSLERDIPHELAHIMIYQATRAGYDRMPVWLDEGIAVNSELQPRSEFTVVLDDAVKRESLIPLSSLCGSFSADINRALLGYAESASVVRYILDRYGSVKVSELLDAYRDGATCEGGVQRVLNLSLSELQTEWQQEKLNSNPYLKFFKDNSILCLPFVPVMLIIASLIFVAKPKDEVG